MNFQHAAFSQLVADLNRGLSQAEFDQKWGDKFVAPGVSAATCLRLLRAAGRLRCAGRRYALKRPSRPVVSHALA
jgi:hypothetical protein